MTALYWGLEYAKVLACYLFLLFIWPSVVFRKYLQGKSKIFRFSFCAVAPIVLYSTAVLGLGLLHLLNAWVVNILFYGTFLFSIRKSIWPDASRRKKLRRLMTGSLKLRMLLSGLLSDFRLRFRMLRKRIWQEARPRLLEGLLLMAVLIFGMIYFSYAVFQDYSYGYGDMNVHHSWAYGLVQGQIFSDGIYPEGMHCILYLMHTVSGIALYSCNLFLGPIHIFVILLSVYCLAREIFCSHITPILVLAVFVIIPMTNRSSVAVYGMNRLGRTLPMEYGMPAQFLCMLFLLRFLKDNFEKTEHKKSRGLLRDENLLLFSLSLAATLEIHYYSTIMAFFMCLPAALFYIKRVISKTRFVPLAAAVLCGVMIAAAPIGLARLSGIPFQGSIGWALSVIQNGREEDLPDQEQTEAEGQENASVAVPLGQRLKEIWSAVTGGIVSVYQYSPLYFDEQGTGMMFLSVLLVAAWLIYRLICILRHTVSKAESYDDYILIVAAMVTFMVLHAAPRINIPELIDSSRVALTAHLLAIMVVAVPFDILFSLLQIYCADMLMQLSAVLCVAVIYAGSVATGNYHGDLYSELFRYNSVVDVTNSIIQSFPQNTYTVVSSTDDLYQIIEYGRHEEWLDFLAKIAQADSYYIPTEYVFVYVEKRPIVHAQFHVATGPFWLTGFDNSDYTHSSRSKFPDVRATEISDADAENEIPEYSYPYQAYKSPVSRTIINSKMYKWCQDFAALYDHEMKIYYEDEDFVCYYFRQNPYSLYDLAIWA